MKEQFEPTHIIEVTSNINEILDLINQILDVEMRTKILSSLKANEEIKIDTILGIESLDPVEYIVFITLCEDSKKIVIENNMEMFKFNEGANIICFVSKNKEAILGLLKKLFVFTEVNAEIHKELDNLFEEDGGEKIR